MRPLRGRNDVGGDRVPGGFDPGYTFNPHFSTTLEGVASGYSFENICVNLRHLRLRASSYNVAKGEIVC